MAILILPQLIYPLERGEGIIGIYHQVSPKHLHRYCIEFGYRCNSKGMKDVVRFEDGVTRIANSRLRYVDLVA